MHDCQSCRRPVGRGWLVCGWCGVSQVPARPKKGVINRIANLVLLLQAMLVVATSLGLAVMWSRAGWTMERAQLLGLVWIGVMAVLGFLAWVSVNLNRQEQRPIFTLRDRQLT